MPVKTRSQTKRENKNHLIACSVARDVVDDIISKIEEENTDECGTCGQVEGERGCGCRHCCPSSDDDDDPKYFMTIWLKDDPEQEHGRGRYFDSKSDALKRFEEIKETLHCCLIMEETDDYEKAIFIWKKDEKEDHYFDIINHEGKEYYVIYKTNLLEDQETGEVYNWRWVMDEDCNHVGYWTGETICFVEGL